MDELVRENKQLKEELEHLHLCRFKSPPKGGDSSGKGNVTTRILNARRCKDTHAQLHQIQKGLLRKKQGSC